MLTFNLALLEMECTENEIWKKIPHVDDSQYVYEVSNLGRVRRILIMCQTFGKSGYPQVRISTPGKCKNYNIHHLVGDLFLDKKDYNVLNHKNSIITDNRAENLEWVYIRENVSHSFVKKDCKRKYTGVYKSDKYGYYSVQINYRGKRFNIGTWPNPELGSLVYLTALKIVGESNRYSRGVSLSEKRITVEDCILEIKAKQNIENKHIIRLYKSLRLFKKRVEDRDAFLLSVSKPLLLLK